MKRANLNFIINALMFISMSAILGIGFLIKFTLVSGQERWAKYGDNVEMLMFGLDRHQWGKIHLIIGLVLIALLILHIVLHWKCVVSVYHKIIKRKYISTIIAVLFTVICALFIFFPFLIKPNITSYDHGRGGDEMHANNIHNMDSSRHHKGELRHNEIIDSSITTKRHKNKDNEFIGNHKNQDANTVGKHKNKGDKTIKMHEHSNLEIEIRGYMTLNEISKKCKVPTDVIKTKLNIPKSFSNDQKVNRLRRDYNIEMHQIKDVIREYKDK